MDLGANASNSPERMADDPGQRTQNAAAPDQSNSGTGVLAPRRSLVSRLVALPHDRLPSAAQRLVKGDEAYAQVGLRADKTILSAENL
jgi:hypothetical protein